MTTFHALQRTSRFAVTAVSALVAVACQGPLADLDFRDPFGWGENADALSVGDVTIYDDTLVDGWADYSWATHSLVNTDPVAAGARSISVRFRPWTGLQFLKSGVSTRNLHSLQFQVNGGNTSNPALYAYVIRNGAVGPPVAVGPYCDGGRIPARAWTTCRVPLSALGATGGTLDGIELQEGAGRVLPTLYVDSLVLSGAVAPAPTMTSSSLPASSSWAPSSSAAPVLSSSFSSSSAVSAPSSTGVSASATSGSSGGVTVVPGPTWLYRDAVEQPWTDGSWATHDLAQASPVSSGNHSISATMAPWTALAFFHAGFPTAGHATLSLQVNGGSAGGAVLLVRALVNDAWTAGTALGPTCTGGSIPPNAWARCDIPLAALAPAGSTLTAIAVQEGRGLSLPTLYFDDVGFDVADAPAGGSSSAANPASSSAAASSSVAGSSSISTSSSAAPGSSSLASGAGTAVSAGMVATQTWTLAGSPYRVLGDITVPGGSTLTIEPGVTVEFQGHFRMTVTGAVDARGTAALPIVFTARDRTAGWYGMRIWNPNGPAGALTGHQYLEHCVFEYSVKRGTNDPWYNDSRGALFIDSNSGPNLHINHNLFRNNGSTGKGAAILLGSVSGNWTMTGNVFQDNHATDQGGAMDLKHSTGILTLVGGAFLRNSTDATTSQPNTAAGAGGAMVIFSDSRLTLDGVTFSGNTPDDWAGIIPVVIGGGTQPVAVSLTPATASLTAGTSRAFTATVTGSTNTAVTWTVQEGSAGGSITSAGVYTAPATAGVFHVVVTSQADTTRSASATVSVSTAPATTTPWVTGYYVGYQSLMYPPAAVDFTAITHLAVGAALPRTDGTIDTSFYIDAVNGPALALDLTARAHLAGRKAILMLGGAGAHALWQGATSATHRAAFVDNILATVNALGFDGVDLDWEPIPVADQPALLALAQALRAASPALIITVPVNWVSANFGADAWFAQLAPYVDQINIMSYQMADAWPGWQSWHSGALAGESATAPSSISSSANAYVSAGVPRSKVGIGIGFYGSCWRGVTGPRQSTATASVVASDNVMTYANILANYHSAAAYTWDSAASVGSLSFASPHGPQQCTWVSYEDDASIAAKGQWVRDNGFGGTIIWTVNEGYIASAGTNPPLEAVKRAFLQ
ncbi:MAG: hypothetical protein HY904_05780 [Deltaproteobacteria bacterium]|nr:hypothetical protein [Deltaproteobacteria bacterium]